MKNILITGPAGFVGTSLCRELLIRGVAVRGAQRNAAPLPIGAESVVVGDINAATDWSAALEDIDTVIHLAARVHIMKDTAADPLAAFRTVNVDGTRRLAEEAAKAGIRRFVLMSTVKVNGEKTDFRLQTLDHRPKTEDCLCSEDLTQRCKDAKACNTAEDKQLCGLSVAGVRNPTAFTELDVPAPEDAYGISKWEAEQALHEVAISAGMETVILRAPLIYGPGVKGNMQSLMKLAASGLPLPLGAVHNQRSLLYVGNLTDFLARCIEHPAAANETFLLSDNHDLSTTELLRSMRRAMGKPPRLLPVPPTLFRLAGRLTGKSAVVNRLFGSLQVDCTKARTLLEWEPPFSVEEGIQAMVERPFRDGLFT
jgi:nucleoside-diphosphate-sugar epimerase